MKEMLLVIDLQYSLIALVSYDLRKEAKKKRPYISVLASKMEIVRWHYFTFVEVDVVI